MRTFSAITFALMFCFAFMGSGNSATVTPSKRDPCAIEIAGPIDAKTPATLDAVIQKVKTGTCRKEGERLRQDLGPNIPTLSLPLNRMILHIQNSPGGDIVAAMQAGRIIRRELMYTDVTPYTSDCVSACVLMYLGGVSRYLFGRLGLHRAYSIRPSQSLSESQDRTSRMIKLVRTYLEEMNIPLRLLDVMNAIPPDEIRWLPDTDPDGRLMGELLLVGADPAFEDLRDSDSAKIYGLTRAEYYERKARAAAMCKGTEDIPSCHMKYMIKK